MHSLFNAEVTRANIEALRIERGFSSPRALAIAAGIPQPTLSRFLTGKSGEMEVENLLAIATALEVTLSELIGEVATSSSREARELAKIADRLEDPQRRALLAAGQAMVESRKRQ